MYKDSPKTFPKGIDPIDASAFCQHLLSDSRDKWYSNGDFLKSGYLQGGGGKYLVAEDATGKTGNGNHLVMRTDFSTKTSLGKLYDTFVLDRSGYLIHRGSGRYVVVKYSTSGGGIDGRLILWNDLGTFGDDHNKFTLNSTGQLVHQGSGGSATVEMASAPYVRVSETPESILKLKFV